MNVKFLALAWHTVFNKYWLFYFDSYNFITFN